MSNSEKNKIKLSLILWICKLKDVNLLHSLEGIMVSNSGGDWWDELTEEEKENIQAGIDDADNGNLISSKEFWRRLKDDQNTVAKRKGKLTKK